MNKQILKIIHIFNFTLSNVIYLISYIYKKYVLNFIYYAFPNE